MWLQAPHWTSSLPPCKALSSFPSGSLSPSPSGSFVLQVLLAPSISAPPPAGYLNPDSPQSLSEGHLPTLYPQNYRAQRWGQHSPALQSVSVALPTSPSSKTFAHSFLCYQGTGPYGLVFSSHITYRETFTMSRGPDVLQMKEEDVLKFLAAGTHLGGTDLDFQMEQDIYKGKSNGIYIINLQRAWKTFAASPSRCCH